MKRSTGVLLVLILIVTLQQVTVFANGLSAGELTKYGIVKEEYLKEKTNDSTVTRAEVTKMLVLMLGLDANGESANFTDVDGHWAEGYISQAKNADVIDGMGDGIFAPDEPITYQQAIKMTVCALGYRPMAEKRGGYPTGYGITATNLGIASREAVMEHTARLGDIITLLTQALDVPIMVEDASGEETVYYISNGENETKLLTLRMKLEQ